MSEFFCVINTNSELISDLAERLSQARATVSENDIGYHLIITKEKGTEISIHYWQNDKCTDIRIPLDKYVTDLQVEYPLVRMINLDVDPPTETLVREAHPSYLIQLDTEFMNMLVSASQKTYQLSIPTGEEELQVVPLN